ncbi:MAG: STAS domain-containing protein [Phycisphaerae bacterium]|nr:STAS domain-containing protein [Phycisphaerae bacterium]
MLAVNCESWGRGVVVRLGGRADFSAVDHLRQSLQEAARQHPRAAIIDASGLEFIGSAGIGVLVEFRKALVRLGGRVVMAGANEYIAGCFKLSRLDQAFEQFATVDAARTALGDPE